MANNDGYIDVISKIKPANRDGFKIIDANDVEYKGRHLSEIDGQSDVVSIEETIDGIYDIITATPTFYLAEEKSNISSDGVSRIGINVITDAPQGDTAKITVLNLTTGTSKTVTGSIKTTHYIDLGVINITGKYDYIISAIDNYNNPMVVDTTKTAPGSYTEPKDPKDPVYQLKFSVFSGSVAYSLNNISNMKINEIFDEEDIEGKSPTEKNILNKIFESLDISGIPNYSSYLNNDDIKIDGRLSYPEVDGGNLSIDERVTYQIRGKNVYINHNEIGYIPFYKYLHLLKLGYEYGPGNELISPSTNTELYYKVEDLSNSNTIIYVQVNHYRDNQQNYRILEEDMNVGIFYDFVENDSGTGEFIKSGDIYIYLVGNPNGQTTYDLKPTKVTTNFLNSSGEINNKHIKQNEDLHFYIQNVVLVTEDKYTISVVTELDKSTVGSSESELLFSTEKSYDIYPIFITRDENNKANTIKVVPVSDIVGPTTDKDIIVKFILISANLAVPSNIRFNAQLFYDLPEGDDIEIKEISRTNCANLSIQTWNMGRMSRGEGHYYYRVVPTSHDSEVSGTRFEYHFNVGASEFDAIQFTKNGLVAYWDATTMTNDMKVPNIWYPTTFVDSIKEDVRNIYIKLTGLNYTMNGWVDYDEDKNKHPHLKFTGDSYGLAYRLTSAGQETELGVMDLLNDAKIAGSDGNGMSFEILYRTRCVGEMKACVASSRIEESRLYPLYSYSDYDKKQASPGVTISHNKIILNSSSTYLDAPFSPDEWKHVTFVINKNESNNFIGDDSNYNPFISIRIYVDGVLTLLKKIENTDDFNIDSKLSQLVLNGSKDIGGLVKNFGESEIRLIRMYNKALSNNEVMNNFISSIYHLDDRNFFAKKNSTSENTIPIIYFVKNSVGNEDDDSGNIRKSGTINTTFANLHKITDKAASKINFVNCTMYYFNPEEDSTRLIHHNNVDVYLQGTSTLQFPIKNLKIKLYEDAKDSTGNLIHGGNKRGKGKMVFMPPGKENEWAPEIEYTLKCDYMESGHINNTPTAKFYDNVIQELVNIRLDSESDNYNLTKSKTYYTQNINGQYGISRNAEFVKLDELPNYNGPKYTDVQTSVKNISSPSRDNFIPVRRSDNSLHYTSETDDLDGIDDGSKRIYSKIDTYYVRIFNNNKYKWIQYDPSDENHYDKLLYTKDLRYKDTIDGFPCIVYYSDNYMESSEPVESAQEGFILQDGDRFKTDTESKGKLVLLGTMMFNLDKAANSTGFEIPPIYEDEYIEYLKSYYVFNIKNGPITFDGSSSISQGQFINDILDGIEFTNISGGDKWLDFDEFICDKEDVGFEWYNVDSDDSDYQSIFADDPPSDIPIYGKYDDKYIFYKQLTEFQLDTLKNNSVSSPDGYWYKKDFNSDYATIPAFRYDQRYIQDNNGNYYYNNILGKYILIGEKVIDPSDRYNLIFDEVRTYNIYDDGGTIKYHRTDKQCMVSYEAATNDNYAAGTFFSIDEAFDLGYTHDYLYVTYLNQFGNNKVVKIANNDANGYTQISPKLNNEFLTFEEFTNMMMGLDVLNGDYDKDEFFFRDNEGPYVLNIQDEFEAYDLDIHGVNIDRYSFNIKFISMDAIYEKDTEGPYYYNEDLEIYELVPENYTGQRYKISGGLEVSNFPLKNKASYIGDKLNGDDESYIDYIENSFEDRSTFVDNIKNLNEDDKTNNTWLPMKGLIKWVTESINASTDLTSKDGTKNIFRKEFKEHLDLTYAIAYYLQMMIFGQVDSAGKNSMWDTWDGKLFYIRPYDMDTELGLNNKGLFNIPSSAEINIEQSPREFKDMSATKTANVSNLLTDKNHMRFGSYSTPNSKFWNAFAKSFKEEIRDAYAILRNNGIYSFDYILNYLKSNSTDLIGERYYNFDMNAKYLSRGDSTVVGDNINLDYLNLLMGNRVDQVTKWLAERLIFCDTFFNYIVNDTLNKDLDLRAEVIGTISIGISVFSPQYIFMSIGAGKDLVLNAFVDPNSKYMYNGVEYEGTLFTLPFGGVNKEFSIYGGGNIKEIFNINALETSDLNLGNARKVIKLELSGNKKIKTLNLENASYLRDLNVSNCTLLEGTLNVSNSINLKTLDISNTKLSGVSFARGGNISTFIAKNVSITTLQFINLQQLSNIEISDSTGIIPVSTYIMEGCPLIKSINLNNFNNITTVRIKNCENLDSLYVESNQTLNTLEIEDCENLRVLSLKNSSGPVLENLNLNTVYGLDKLDLTSCKSTNGINVNLPYFRDSKTANEIGDNDPIYNERWHRLKYLLCRTSDIKSVTYGTSDINKNIMNLEPLDMLIGIDLINCKNITDIVGLKFNGSPTLIHRDNQSYGIFSECENLKNVKDSYLYRNSSNLTRFFTKCKQLEDFSTLNINLYSKLTPDLQSYNIVLDSVFRESTYNEPMLRTVIHSGRDYDLELIPKPSNKTSYDLQEYLVRDLNPHYLPIRIESDKLYVFSINSGTKTFTDYEVYINNKINENPNYNSTLDPNLSALYYKVYSSGNYYVNSGLGKYIYVNNDFGNSNNYFMEVTTANYTLNNEPLTEIPTEYRINGMVIKRINNNIETYLRYHNNILYESSLYTFFDDNTLDLTINGNQAPGGIYNTSNNVFSNLDYSNHTQTKKSTMTIPYVNPETEYINNDRICNNSILNKDYKYYRIYNPEKDIEINNIFKKQYISTYNNKNRFISDIGLICYGTSSYLNNKDINILEHTFDGLEKCTTASLSFSSANIKSIDYRAFNKLESLTNAQLMFSSNRIEKLDSRMFVNDGTGVNVVKIEIGSAMFRGCSSLTGFYKGSENKRTYYYDISGIKKSILPTTLKRTESMFEGCTALIMENEDLNGILSGLIDVEFAWSMFRNCSNIRHMCNQPLKDMIKLKDISSMFAGCINLNALNLSHIEPDNYENATEDLESDIDFSLVDISKTYNDLTLAYSLFYNCINLKGFLNEKFLAYNNKGAINLKTLGIDYNINSTSHSSAGHKAIGGGTTPIVNIYGGAFSNTKVYSYHKDFLSNLNNLENISGLFNKVNPSNGIIYHEKSDLTTVFYGYGITGQDGIEIISGIPEDLFKNNSKLKNASYMFAGNMAIDRDTAELNNLSQIEKLSNIFNYTPNMEYAIGMFMNTTASTLDNGEGVPIETKYFFKYYNINEDKYIGLDNLRSIKSIFENSNYGIIDFIHPEIFDGCKSLTDVSMMFKNNKNIRGYENVIPIELFNDCRGSIINTSSMFQGCKNLVGKLPVGDNTWLSAYFIYLENIKEDPDITTVYPRIKTRSIAQIFDDLEEGEYKDYNIVKEFNSYMKLLSFTEFLENNTIYRSKNNVEIGDSNESFHLKPYYYLSDDKYSVLSDNFIRISKIENIFTKDRSNPETITMNHIDKYIIEPDKNNKLTRLTNGNINNYKNKEYPISLYNEVGSYGRVYDEGSSKYIYIPLTELGSEYDPANGYYLEKAAIYIEDSGNNGTYILNRTVYNIYDLNNLDAEGYLIPLIRNRRYIVNESENVEGIDYYKLILNGDPINIGDLLDSLFIGPPISIDISNSYETGYKRGLLGSCKNLQTSSHMFNGCENITGKVPRDIFSAESPKTQLTKLTNISYMFSSCPNLAIQYNLGENKYERDGNPEYIYERNYDYDLIEEGEYLVPKDWLQNAKDIANISYLFSRIGTLSSESSADSKLKESEIKSGKFIIFPNDIFSNLKKLQNLSHFLYGSILISGDLDFNFMRDSLVSLQYLDYAFSHTNILGLGMGENPRIFEFGNVVNNKLLSVYATFYNCKNLNNDNTKYPRFDISSKFSTIPVQNMTYCFTGTNLTGISDNLKQSPTSSASLAYIVSRGYYSENLSNTQGVNTILGSLPTIIL